MSDSGTELDLWKGQMRQDGSGHYLFSDDFLSGLSEKSEYEDLEPFAIYDQFDVSDYVRNFASIADTHEVGQSCRVYWTQQRKGDAAVFRFSAVWNEVHCLVDVISESEETPKISKISWVKSPDSAVDVVEDIFDSTDDGRPAVVNAFLDGFSAWYSESDDCEGDQLVALSFQYVDVEAFEKAKRDELD